MAANPAAISNGGTVNLAAAVSQTVDLELSGGSTLNRNRGGIDHRCGHQQCDWGDTECGGGSLTLNGNNNFRGYGGGVVNVSSGSVGFALVRYYVLASTAASATINLRAPLPLGTAI